MIQNQAELSMHPSSTPQPQSTREQYIEYNHSICWSQVLISLCSNPRVGSACVLGSVWFFLFASMLSTNNFTTTRTCFLSTSLKKRDTHGGKCKVILVGVHKWLVGKFHSSKLAFGHYFITQPAWAGRDSIPLNIF